MDLITLKIEYFDSPR